MNTTAESITNDRNKFEEAVNCFLGSGKPGAAVVTTYVGNSQGYAYAGTNYPAVYVEVSDIKGVLDPAMQISKLDKTKTEFRPGNALIMGFGKLREKQANKQRDVSIEYAHIYTNSSVGEEQLSTIHVLKKIKAGLEKKRKSFLLVVLVDDYSFPNRAFNYRRFNQWLCDHGAQPDIIFRESQLIPLCDEVLDNITDEKIKEEIVTYIRIKKYPCSLFIAVWYLMRLGYIKTPLFDEKYYVSQLVNILPISFKPYEDRALEIIAKTEFAGAEKQIVYHFLKEEISDKKSKHLNSRNNLFQNNEITVENIFIETSE